jgi:hypothetical protein
VTAFLPDDRMSERPTAGERFAAVDLRDGSSDPHAVVDHEGRIVSRWPARYRARSEASDQAHAAEYRALQDDVLERASQLDPADRSLQARQTRETAASIRDHRENAARREVRAAADALGVSAPPPPDHGLSAEGQDRRTVYYRDQATFLRRLGEQRDSGELDEETAQWEASLYREDADMARAAQGLPSGGGGWLGADAVRWTPDPDEDAPAPDPGDEPDVPQAPLSAPASPGRPAGEPNPDTKGDDMTEIPSGELAGDSPYQAAQVALEGYERLAERNEQAAETLEAQLTVHGFDRDQALMEHIRGVRESAGQIRAHAAQARQVLVDHHGTGAEYHQSGTDAHASAFRA